MKPHAFRIAVWMAISALLSNSLAGESDAAEFRAIPSIRLGQGWDSNIFNTTANEVSDFFFTATPELLLSAATENLTLDLTGEITGRWYYQNPEVSAWNYSEGAHLSGEARVTDRFSLTPAAYYVKASDQYQRSLLISMDPALPSPGIATYGLQKVTNFGASIGLRYLVNPRVETGGTVFMAAERYPTGIAADSSTLGGDARFRYLFGPRSSLGGYVATNYTDYEESPDSWILGFGLLGGYQFTPVFKLDWRLGMAFAQVAASAGIPGTPRQSTQTPAGTISLGYNDNTFEANLFVNAGYSGLGGAGQVTQQVTAGVTMNDQFGERWFWHLGGYYQISRDAFEEPAGKASTAGGTAGIRYAPWELVSFDLTGYATREWSDLPENSLNRYSAVLGFTLGKNETAY